MVDFDKNTPLVYYIYDRYYKKYGRYKDDLIQCGMLGLWKACKRFDANNNCRFSTFASICIRNEMGMFMRKQRKFDDNVVDMVIVLADGKQVDLMEFVEDDSKGRIDEDLHVQLCLDGKEMFIESLKGKTIKQIAKEKNRSVTSVCNALMREKRDIEQIM